MSRLISRDAFARTELHKHARIAKGTVGYSCDWCGSEGKGLWQFSTKTDGGRTFLHKGLTCSVSCFRSYSN